MQALLKIYDIVGDPVWISAQDAQKVYDQIVTAFNAGRKVKLSFAQRDILIPTFLNAAIGQLYSVYTEEFLKDNLSVVDISSEDRKVLNVVVENAKRYFANQSAYDEAWREELHCNEE